MHADLSRWTFDPAAGYRSVLLQQGRVLLDADWNEQGAITARHDEVRTRDIIGRAGGPADGAAFALTDAAQDPPAGTAWEELHLSRGRFYLDGVLAEVPGSGLGPALTDQPFLRPVGDLPGLAEPTDDGRYAVVLDVWTREVTGDEEPALLESALGGPDTTTRTQVVWQVVLHPVADTDACAGLAGAAWLTRTPPTMTATLADVPPESDPCLISTSAGYRRLENQLYRVQVSAVAGDGTAHYVWSRENGSVVAALRQITEPTVPGPDVNLHLDREGRDEELSFGEGDVVEITSRDRELRALPALLGTAGAPDGLVLPVTWIGNSGSDPAAGDMSQLGEAPLVRRWEGGPAPVGPSAQDLEDGIQVTFGGGDFRVGDYWLIPARTVRLVYGVSALSGTIEWPTTTDAGGDEVPAAQPPLGPELRRTVVGVLERTGGDADGQWTLVSDCRRLTPPLTELVTIDLLGGDGQESLPGEPLPEPVRVAVRNGGVPVAGANVRFTSDGDHLRASDPSAPGPGAPPTSGDPSEIPVPTDSDGHAQVRWLLDGAPDAHVLSAVLLDDSGAPVGAQVRVTARRSLASQVGWQPACEGMAGATTVQDALGRLATTADLRLLGGDGQQVREPGATVPREVRVVLDSPCGPLEGQAVSAEASERGLVVPAEPGEADPGSLSGTGATSSARARTGADGVAAFWWQPDVRKQPSDVLDIVSKGAEPAPIRVSAHRAVQGGGGRPPGIHITHLHFGDGNEFLNDEVVTLETLASGIMVELDAPVLQESVQGKPVARVEFDLPWPTEGEARFWSDQPVGFRATRLDGEVGTETAPIEWQPTEITRGWLLTFGERVERLHRGFPEAVPKGLVLARFIIDGWAIIGQDDPQVHLNTHANASSDGSHTRLDLPTDDEVTGGQFVQWFYVGAQ
ncbi:DUF6519 domain-containing protein [Pseudactinotalea sp. Z1739]|uniref:DUF6519 domain-containing protein n=1 Tax=Pseudactinotalea sp. Z1739 TaxID=3413028 RepID=UPI003C7CB3B2